MKIDGRRGRPLPRCRATQRGQVHAGKLDIPDPEAACHQFRMLTYGELRERMLLGENITEETIATTIERAVTLFLDGYAVDRRGTREGIS